MQCAIYLCIHRGSLPENTAALQRYFWARIMPDRQPAQSMPDKISLAICQMESPSAASQGWAAAEFQIGLITATHRAIPRPKMISLNALRGAREAPPGASRPSQPIPCDGNMRNQGRTVVAVP